MKKYILCFFIFSLMVSCTTTRSNDYSSFQRNFQSNLEFYHQYERLDLIKVKTGKGVKQVLVSNPFLADVNKDLSSSVIKLQVGLLIKNPNRKKLEVLANQEILSLEEDKTYIKDRSKIPVDNLSREFIKFDMPFKTNIHAQVIFSVDVFLDGEIVYSTSVAKYKIGKN